MQMWIEKYFKIFNKISIKSKINYSPKCKNKTTNVEKLRKSLKKQKFFKFLNKNKNSIFSIKKSLNHQKLAKIRCWTKIDYGRKIDHGRKFDFWR